MWTSLAGVIVLAATVLSHDHDHDQEIIEGPHQKLWYNVLPGDGGTQVSQLRTFMVLFTYT